MRVCMVSGSRRALRSEITSWPPEKICLTATADPGKREKKLNVGL